MGLTGWTTLPAMGEEGGHLGQGIPARASRPAWPAWEADDPGQPLGMSLTGWATLPAIGGGHPGQPGGSGHLGQPGQLTPPSRGSDPLRVAPKVTQSYKDEQGGQLRLLKSHRWLTPPW